MRVIALALSLLAVVPGATPLAPGAPRFAQLAEVQGMPADSASRYAFLDGLRGMFAEDVLETEDADGGQPDRVPNRFRLLEGDEAQDAWRIGLVLGAPPVLRPAGKVTSRGSAPRIELRRAGRGLTVVLTVRSPEEVTAGTTPDATRCSLAFPRDSAEAAPRLATGVPAGGLFPWHEAGRACGSLLLETLHHRSGDLATTRRVTIAPARRVPEREAP